MAATDGQKKMAAALPDAIGVYIIRDCSGKVIYVGKSTRIRSRIHSHLNPDGASPKAGTMAGLIDSVDCILCETEVEALILENNFIKRHMPKYNIRLRDDKSYPWVKVSVKDPYPAITITRLAQKDGSKYFGPYMNMDGLEESIKFLRRVFPLRSCELKIVPGKPARKRPCLDQHLGRCLAPCTDPNQSPAYADAVAGICRFLEGRQDGISEQLCERMLAHAKMQEFEAAAKARDLLQGLSKIASRQRVMASGGRSYDLFAAASDLQGAGVIVFFVRGGKLVGKRHYLLDRGAEGTDSEILSSFIERFYDRNADIPAIVHVPPGTPGTDAIAGWLQKETGRAIEIIVPRSRGMLKMAQGNAEYFLRVNRPEWMSSGVPELQQALGLASPPMRMEAMDISTGSGRDSVGSVVSFWAGKPQKSQYRKFRIKRVPGQDDFAQLAEVATRRFGRLAREGCQMPDLVLVDGGRGQLSAVEKALESLGLSALPVVSLAKGNEEIYATKDAAPLRLPRSHPGLQLLQRARDEAHRFAVSYHRALRGRRVRSSVLSDIPGIGPARARRLLAHFGSLKGVAAADAAGIAAACGTGEKAARALKEALRESL